MQSKRSNIFLVFLLSASAALAQGDICADLDTYLDGTDASLPFSFDRPVTCNTSIPMGGGQSRDCSWVFDYRSAKANEMFTRIGAALDRCAKVIDVEDTAVSHPDSYVLRQFVSDRGIFAVSLKDKAALSQTYVFFRAATRKP